MIAENEEQQGNGARFIFCQVPACESKQICSIDNVIYCVDCDKVLCNPCYQCHNMQHCILENADLNTLPRITYHDQPQNILPYINLDDFNNAPSIRMTQNQQSMVNAQNNFQLKDKKEASTLIPYPLQQRNLPTISITHQLNILNQNDQDDDDEDDEDVFKRSFQVKQEENKYQVDSEDSDDEDERMRMMIQNGKISKMDTYSDIHHSSNQSPNQSLNINPSASNAYLNVPSGKYDMHPQYQNLSISSLSINGQSSRSLWQSNSNSTFELPQQNQLNRSNLTPVMEKIKQFGRYDKQMAMFEKTKLIPKNKLPKKTAKILVKKKNRLNKEDYENEDDENTIGDEIIIPDIEDRVQVQPQYDTKSLNELKNKAKKMFESIKGETEIILKEAKPHIHGVQYAKDEIERVNKYKKYAMEGIDCYFLYLKDAFSIEYDKLKKCKKRNRLSRMIGKLVKIMDTFSFLREPKDFVIFLNRDYVKFFDQVKDQLKEIQVEGSDLPPSFKIVYENLYDIFDSLMSFMSLNLSNSRQYNSVTQPIISASSSNHNLIPVFYPSKNLVALWNCSTSEIIETRYAGNGQEEFRSHQNYQIVNDSEFIYFIGGQIFNEERNNFTPTVKCFKMSIRNGQILPIQDLPFPKIKFGISISNKKIYIFGGLQTIERLRSNTCECYDITSDSWMSLPRMKKNRVCPIQCVFVPQAESLIQQRSTLILTIGGMEDKNNINYSIEVFDTQSNDWIEFIERPANGKCYIPKQLGYAIQINPEQILICGGLSGRKQKPTCGLQVYNVSKKSIINISLDSLPIGLINDYHCGQPIIHNKSIFVLNTQISQYFPTLKQLEGVCNILKIGLNQQEIICTHAF